MASYVGILADLTQTIQVIGPPVCREIGLLTNLQNNINILVEEAELLKRKRENLEADGEEASRKRQKLTNQEDSCWRQKAEDSIKEIESMKSEFQNTEAMSNWNYAKYLSRYRLVRRIIEMDKTIEDLKERAIFSPPRVLEMPLSISTHGQNAFEQTLKKIWDHLHDEHSHIIGVCGMGGVGKTTLLTIINNRLIDTKAFDIVIFFTISRCFNLGKIQKKIMRRLELNFDENDDEERSAQVLAALKSKRFLLILDNLWEAIQLDQVGIPKPDRQNKSKIIIATRNVDVCNDMEVDVFTKVKTLKKVEAWNLFLENAGEVALQPDIQHLANKVAMECNGLPLAIIAVGRALKGKQDKQIWRNALRELKESTSEIRGMKSEVFPALKFSYDHLGDQKIKYCFLYCSLYPEDYEIDIEELARLWVIEGFIGDGVDLVAAIDKGYHILDRIKDASLLEGGRKGDMQFVKMHSLVRDMALWITSSSFDDSPRFLVRAGVGLREPPQEEMWREKERISLMRNEITSLPFKPDCPNLVSFSVRENPYLTTIHSSFFESMSKLSHLDLSFTAIESLPMSIGSVQGLRYLSLRGCEKLSDITHLRNTQDLRVLDLSHSGIRNLPPVMERLTRLIHLNLSFMKELSTVPGNLISAAPNLEELILYGTSINWAVVGEQDVRETRLAEVATLEHLRTLEITIPDPECVAEDFHRQLPTLDRFKISIGPNNFTEISLPCAKQVYIHASGRCSDGVKAILAHAEGVFLNGTETKHFSQIVGNSKNLRIVRIEACQEMESFINWRDVGDGALQNIEELCLYEIPALKKIFDGEAPQKLQKLRAIVVYQCNSLKYLFSSEMVQYLDRLELLFVSHCEDLEEIIDRDELLPDNPLPSLRTLILFKLGKLRSISCSLSVTLPSLTELFQDFCPRLMLPDCPSITRIKESADASQRVPRHPPRYR